MSQNLEAWAVTQGYDPDHDYTTSDGGVIIPDNMFSEHFSHAEFMCKCRNNSYGPLCNGWGGGTHTVMDPELFPLLEKIRAHFGEAFNVNSGYRCPGHNAKQGGASKSLHMQGKAADIWSNHVSPAEVYAYADSINPNGGVGKYNSFTHVDVRGYHSRWTG